VFHELCAYQSYHGMDDALSYWRLASGIEVDFIIGDMCLAIEAKSSARITSDHLRGLREIIKDHTALPRRIVVSLEERARTTQDGIDIVPYKMFTQQLWSGALIHAV
jgi:uncharacterized protein